MTSRWSFIWSFEVRISNLQKILFLIKGRWVNRDGDDGDDHRGCQCDGDGAGAIADTATRSAHQLERSASKKSTNF